MDTEHDDLEQKKPSELAALLAAMITGDRWLSASACAAYLGQIRRRTFLENIACQPDFPTALPMGKVKAWKKSEVEAWAQHHRRTLPRGRRHHLRQPTPAVKGPSVA